MDELETLEKIRTLVNKFLKDLGAIDTEQISIDIWIELWTSGKKEVYALHVKHRCVDAVRRERSRRLTSLREGKLREKLDKGGLDLEENLGVQSLVDSLMSCPELTPQDKNLIWNRFYKGLSIEELGILFSTTPEAMKARLFRAIEKLRTWARFICPKGV
jgi:DNA-directed RNA polymerase specialized sigma24 family protein